MKLRIYLLPPNKREDHHSFQDFRDVKHFFAEGNGVVNIEFNDQSELSVLSTGLSAEEDNGKIIAIVAPWFSPIRLPQKKVDEIVEELAAHAK